ncbi:sugar phosphate isomerase/epimerase family protein [Ornithinicoccus hortensis]|uniref:Sugar phosphate isomerase/epimerase n=1 Tax=Ornithinicoccus hortensis TaxID=82346 RepID=A0A542YW55_9MICO|nr:sugar phosphate isomerase/epimerase [Ornithinicoccus hortensis]TQL52214.1 sugar phosphate isomerase/epimerase [Ornithinicoccus hortensis]
MTLPVLLSTASVYPENCAYAFDLAERLGYDGVEVMVWTDPVTQEAGALRALSDLHGLPVGAIHAPTLLLSQRIWGWQPWGKIDRSLQLAADVGADTVVVHPPFRWQREYASGFVEGVSRREQDLDGIKIAVENMFPWRAATSEMQAYLPHWDPLDQDYAHVTLDVSHAATGQVDAVDLAEKLGARVSHIHLADSLGSFKDEHLVPGRGDQPCAELLRWLLDQEYAGAVTIEVGTRKLDPERRELDLAEALAFTREHLGQDRARTPIPE